MFDLPPDSFSDLQLTPVTAQCVEHSADFYQVHPDILYAILLVERGEVGKATVDVNSDGTRDIGPAQVNSIHLPELRELGISETELKSDGCLNIYVQARYLSIVLSQVDSIQSEEEYLFAIARYHNKDRKIATPYVLKLRGAFNALYRSRSGEEN